jgi:shikimate kinase
MKSQKRIVLVGFMGAGKSSVAEILSHHLNCQWVDLDEFIESNENKTVAEIISNLGEEVFREIESDSLEQIMAAESLRVVSLGGGAWMNEANREIIKKNDCLSFWLNTPFETCWQRISQDKTSRPLAKNKTNARKLYKERKDSYALADVSLTIKAKQAPEEIASKIISRIKKNKV